MTERRTGIIPALQPITLLEGGLTVQQLGIITETLARLIHKVNELSRVEPAASVEPSDSVVSETAAGQAATAGTSDDYARGDHTHGTPAPATHEIVSETHTDTESLTPPQDGNILFYENGFWKVLTTGSEGTFLTISSGVPRWV
jgi:hypothetical protein